MFRRKRSTPGFTPSPEEVLAWWQSAHGSLDPSSRTRFLKHRAIAGLCRLTPDRVCNAVRAHRTLDEALACAQWHATRDGLTAPTNWRMLTPEHIRRLTRERKLIVRRGEFIEGRFKRPELVVRVTNHGMTLSTLDQAGSHWQRRQQPCKYWVTFPELTVF